MSGDRQKVRQRAGRDYVLQDLDGPGMTLAEMRTELGILIEMHGEEAILTTEACGSCETCEADLDEVELISRVWVERDENDAELDKRHKDDARRALALEADARRQYEKLRERFEPKPAPESASSNVDDAKPGSAP